jgi:uncharacterized protein (TIRG00374 family)
MQQPQRHPGGTRLLRHILRWGLAIAVSGAAAWLGLRQVQWSTAAASLARASTLLVALGLATVLVTSAVKALRWHLLLRQCGASVGGWRAFRVLMIGQLGNGFLPVRLGDLARAILVAPQTKGGAAGALGTVAAEKLLDGIVGMLVILGIALAAHLPAWLQRPALVLAAITAVLLALLVLVLAWPRRLAPTFVALSRGLSAGRTREDPSRKGWWNGFQRLLSGFRRGLIVLGAPSALLPGLALSGAVWALGAVTNRVMLAAIGVDVPIWANLLVLVSVYLVTFLPAVPAQIGIFEYACILALGAGGLPAEAALAFGLLLHLVVYAPPALLGPVFAAMEGLRWSSLAANGRAARSD